MKKIIQTHTLLKKILKNKHQLKNKPILSHITIIKLPTKKTFLLTNYTINITPTQTTLIKIIKNTKKITQKLKLHHPKITLLNTAKNFNPKIPSSILTKKITTHFNNQQKTTIFKPLSLNLTTSKKTITHKHYNNPIIKNTNILIIPTINIKNYLYKSLTLFKHTKIKKTIINTKIPIILTSKNNSTKNKFHSLKFTIKQI